MNPLFWLLFISPFFFTCNVDKAEPGDMPNIIILLADDLGYGDLGCYGCADIETPNIDLLAEQGVRFTQFYSNGPECTPTRAALLSGLYQQRIGGLECAIGAGNVGRYDDAMWLAEQNELGLPPEFAVLPHQLNQIGYNTAIIGKWHLGYEEKFRPDKQGFDYSLGPLGYGGDYFYHVEQADIGQDDFTKAHNLAENGDEIFLDGEYMTDIITREAVNWLAGQEKGKPFFLYVPFTAPHSPYQGPGDDLGRPITGDEWNFKSREKYIEMTEAMDEGIGEILTKLDEMDLDQETIVIFFSDNGGTREANNGILSGYKGHVWEGGIRVPCIIRWPGKIEEDTISDQVCIGFDLSHSVLDLTGMNNEDLQLDGYDIINHIVEEKTDFDRTLFWRNKRGQIVKKAVRDGDYKYLIELRDGNTYLEKIFDLKADPSETNDLLMMEPEKADELKMLLVNWEQEVRAERLQDSAGTVFSPIDLFGDAANYSEAEPWLWNVFNYSGDTVYGIIEDKPAGGNRTSIMEGATIGGTEYYVKADMKLHKRPDGSTDQALFEDGILFFAWQDANNHAKALFYNTSRQPKDPIYQWEGLGVSGFYFMVDGKGYGYKKSDDPGDPTEEIPPERCIPYVNDESFNDWNEIKVTFEDSVLSMLVNGEVYHAIGLDTATIIQYYTSYTLESIDTLPSAVIDLLYTPGYIGIGSGNDRVYFDNVEAGIITGVVESVMNDLSRSILIYPNPASNQFTIDKTERVNVIEVYNLAGMKVMETLTCRESSVTISTKRFETGVYFVRTILDTGEVTINKLIII